jgi:DNA-binding response OmpR family regulator
MSLIHLPESVEARRTPATVAVVGLLGAQRAQVLAAAGCTVVLEPTIVFARLDVSDLLVVAPAPPEPAALALIRHLRERSAIRVLALVPAPSEADRRLLFESGADGCLDAAGTDEDLLAAVGALLDHRRDRVATDDSLPSRTVSRERLPA